eukprot:1059537_1
MLSPFLKLHPTRMKLLSILVCIAVATATSPVKRMLNHLRGAIGSYRNSKVLTPQNIMSRDNDGIPLDKRKTLTPRELQGYDGYCASLYPDGNFTEVLPIYLDLSNTANSDKPSIDGIVSMTSDGLFQDDSDWNGTEYESFLDIAMFNGGKNENGERIGTTYVGYDQENDILCVAAHLDATYLSSGFPGDSNTRDESNICFIDTTVANTWVEYGGLGKLTQSESS